jgi:uncharacterized protein GlcG (DUF336 family)
MALDLQHARLMIERGEATAKRLGVSVIIAVVDPATNLKAFARMDGAVLGSIDIAIKKAKTAALFECNSEDVWEYCKPGAPAHGLENTNGGLAPFAGGVLIRDDAGKAIGAVGVSGGAVQQDLEIATAATEIFKHAVL